MAENLSDIHVMRRFEADNVYMYGNRDEKDIMRAAYIQHSLDLVDLYIAIVDDCRKYGYKLDFLKAEVRLLNGSMPDLVMVYRRGDDVSRLLYIEYDRGTRPLTGEKKKILAYSEYLKNRQYLEEPFQPGSAAPGMVYVCTSAAREKHLADMLGPFGVKVTCTVSKLFLY
jgi:hypothetical protein